MHPTLSELQCERIKPTFEYVARAIELQRPGARPPSGKNVSDIGDDLRSLTEMSEDLPEEYQWAIQAVVRMEIHTLLMACMTQAAAIRLMGKTTAGL